MEEKKEGYLKRSVGLYGIVITGQQMVQLLNNSSFQKWTERVLYNICIIGLELNFTIFNIYL